MAIIGLSGKMRVGKDKSGLILQYLTSSYNKTYTLDEWLDRVENQGLSPNSFFEIRKFADKLKDVMCLLISCTRKQLENEQFKNTELPEEWWYYKVYSNITQDKFKLIPYDGKTGFYDRNANYKGHVLIKPTPRLLLQLLGTDCGRKIIHPNIWCISLMAEYKSIEHPQLAGTYAEKSRIVTYPNWLVTDVRFPNEVKAIQDKKGVVIRVERPSIIKDNFTASTHESEIALDGYTGFNYTVINDGTLEELMYKLKTILNELKN
jgi:hypothetical protein